MSEKSLKNNQILLFYNNQVNLGRDSVWSIFFQFLTQPSHP